MRVELPEKQNMKFPKNFDACPDCYYWPFYGRFYQKKLEMLFDFIPAKGQTVLEIGFGAGIAFKELSKRFKKVFAIDVHPHFADVKSMMANENMKNIELLKHDIFKEPLDIPAPDYIFSSSVFEHIHPEPMERGLIHIKQLLAKDGFFLVGFPLKSSVMNLNFKIYEKLVKPWVKGIYDFSVDKDHPSAEAEIVPLLEKHFNILEKKYYLNKMLKIYLCIKCQKKN